MNNSLFLHYFSIFSSLYIREKEEATKDFTKAKKNEYSVRRKLCSRACQDNEVYEDLSYAIYTFDEKKPWRSCFFKVIFSLMGKIMHVIKEIWKKHPKNGQYNNGFETFLANALWHSFSIVIGVCLLKKRNRSALSLL